MAEKNDEIIITPDVDISDSTINGDATEEPPTPIEPVREAYDFDNIVNEDYGFSVIDSESGTRKDVTDIIPIDSSSFFGKVDGVQYVFYRNGTDSSDGRFSDPLAVKPQQPTQTDRSVGMRDEFAKAAMQAMLMRVNVNPWQLTKEDRKTLAEKAFAIADAMLQGGIPTNE